MCIGRLEYILNILVRYIDVYPLYIRFVFENRLNEGVPISRCEPSSYVIRMIKLELLQLLFLYNNKSLSSMQTSSVRWVDKVR